MTGIHHNYPINILPQITYNVTGNVCVSIIILTHQSCLKCNTFLRSIIISRIVYNGTQKCYYLIVFNYYLSVFNCQCMYMYMASDHVHIHVHAHTTCNYHSHLMKSLNLYTLCADATGIECHVTYNALEHVIP